MIKIKEFRRGSEENMDCVSFQLFRLGRDWLLWISGGEAHLGSVAASDHSSGKGSHQFTLGIHKEGPIVRQALEALQPLITEEILVIGGIHYDNLNSIQIKKIIQHSQELIYEVVLFFSVSERPVPA